MEGNIPQINFLIEKRIFNTITEDEQLVFLNEDPSGKRKPLKRVIQFSDVLQVHVLQQIMSSKGEKSSSGSSSTSSDHLPPSSAIIIDYVRKVGITAPKKIVTLIPNTADNFLWEPAKVVMKCPSDFYPLCVKIAEKINTYITEKETQRPKSLLVIINPVSGQKKGQSVFANQVQPLFTLAGIKTEVIVSKSETHAKEILESYDISSIDGVVSVGGDGMYTQVINALVHRTAKDRGLDLNDIEVDLGQLPLRIGIIPSGIFLSASVAFAIVKYVSGTGQGCIRMLTGRFDPVTAAMHIILGTETEVNLVSVHSGSQLVFYGSMLACFGFFGETIKESESRRKLGRLRYPVCMLKSLMKFNKHEIEVQVRSCSQPDSWETLSGSYVCANIWLWDMYAINMRDADPVERYLNMMRSWQEGSLILELVHSSSGRMDFMKHFKDTMTFSETLHSCAKIMECSGFRLRMLANAGRDIPESERVLNIDGDPFMLPDASYEIRLKRRMLKMFGSGVDENLRYRVSEAFVTFSYHTEFTEELWHCSAVKK
ncbi:hypothetical protein CAPTEDRAFT_229384 [Capitella teleta]|uniref:DAGKc domain-containing protein n=1 Tax=Capitella teleta TaxID=283909 RepID=R7UMD8_CAPTE|nr:hypothetical protein CAPTEDRAFT_229384 [Capitella teleta]|eukprot:ELU05072.1 hypothetical protein CAPTEDRAFT_229384 [Capitella teleta]